MANFMPVLVTILMIFYILTFLPILYYSQQDTCNAHLEGKTIQLKNDHMNGLKVRRIQINAFFISKK